MSYAYTSDSDLEDTESSDDNSSVQDTYAKSSKAKLPPFNGKEDWKIWYARFEETAERKRFSEN